MFEFLDPAGPEGSSTSEFSVCQQINSPQLLWVAFDSVIERTLTIRKGGWEDKEGAYRKGYGTEGVPTGTTESI